jgi:hypothetical protein
MNEKKDIRSALVAGLEQITAWSGLLDRINVFPVADGDTGRNLVISLSPLKRIDASPAEIANDLLFAASGNAGNISARFFHELIQADHLHALPEAIRLGRDQAWQAVGDPQPGTILTFFDELAVRFREKPPTITEEWASQTIDHLTQTVRETTEQQPRLKKGGVVDSGALGMFLFFHGFLHCLIGPPEAVCPIPSLFANRIQVNPNMDREAESGYCVDTVLEDAGRLERNQTDLQKGLGESVVLMRSGPNLKIHLHTTDRKQARQELEKFGNVLRWSEDNLAEQMAAFEAVPEQKAIHIMTDAAGSLTRTQAGMLGITLLDSYILIGNKSYPESCIAPEFLYSAMRKGEPVSTSQASVHERRQSYRAACSLFEKVLYLCVGSAFTGNYDAAIQWKKEDDPNEALTVIDPGCAGGRLGLLADLAAKSALETNDPEEVIAYAREAIDHCQEYIFVDTLRYLAAGGRLSRTSAFFGDLLHKKPVISPQADGAQKVGMVRNSEEQVAFALRKLDSYLKNHTETAIWLEYTDNSDWLHEYVYPLIIARFPAAEISVKPMSLTTGAHIGPGAWGLAFATSNE